MTDADKFIPQEIIRIKRDGHEITSSDLVRFVSGITDGSISDAQMAAFAMAVFIQGMSAREGAKLTLAMRDSGAVIDWRRLGFEAGAPIVDKHSTGGVGDKVSLILAPIVAACGGLVPMISGRALGHTGGTLDKLAAIPGYDVSPDTGKFAAIVKNAGCSIIGQTGELAPADKRLYAIRDVTATVESVPLITASILSKKLAAGVGALVMDVKFGNGAFMKPRPRARALAENIVAVAGEAGLPARAVLTDMNQVLGRTAGNAVEVAEAAEVLTKPSSADGRLLDVTLELAAHMLVLARLAPDLKQAEGIARSALTSGRAAERFARMVAAHGGPADLAEDAFRHLPGAPVVRPVFPEHPGYVASMDTRAIGLAIVTLGGGRTNPTQAIDPAVGFTRMCQLGESVGEHAPLAMVHARSNGDAKAAASTLRKAITVADIAPKVAPVVMDVIGV